MSAAIEGKEGDEEAEKIGKESCDVAGGVLGVSIEGIAGVRTENGELLTEQFIHVCRSMFRVLDAFGIAFAIIRSDVDGNIKRLEKKLSSDRSKYNNLHVVVLEEVEANTAKQPSSCTCALLWLTRYMDFLVDLIQNLLGHPDCTMFEACNGSYNSTLKKWHGMFETVCAETAMRAVPDRARFIKILGCSGDVEPYMEKFCAAYTPFLTENHSFLASVGCDT